MTVIKVANGSPVQVGTLEPEKSAQAENSTGINPAEQKPSQPPRDTSKVNRLRVLEQQKLREFEETFKASNAYNILHAKLAEKFPEIGEPDGTPIGVKLTALRGPMLTKDDLLPGDIIVAYEPDPANVRPNRRVTVTKQQAAHNGIPVIPWHGNQGDFKGVHMAIWCQTKGNLQATEPWGYGEPEVVEARAARDRKPKPINRVQPAAASAAEMRYAKVYRPTNRNFGDWMAQVAMVMANGHIEYVTKAMSLAAKGHYEFNDKAKKDAVRVARDAFNPTPEWALNHVNTADRFREGVHCTSFVNKVAQAAMLQILQAQEFEKTGKTVPLEDLVDRLTGFCALNADHTSVSVNEHFLNFGKDPDGDHQFEFIGKFEVKPEDVRYPEVTPPMDPAQLPPLPPQHPHSIEFQQKLKQERLAKEPIKANL